MAKIIINCDENVKSLYKKIAKMNGKTLSAYVMDVLEKAVVKQFEMEEIESEQKRRMANKIIKN